MYSLETSGKDIYVKPLESGYSVSMVGKFASFKESCEFFIYFYHVLWKRVLMDDKKIYFCTEENRKFCPKWCRYYYVGCRKQCEDAEKEGNLLERTAHS